VKIKIALLVMVLSGALSALLISISCNQIAGLEKGELEEDACDGGIECDSDCDCGIEWPRETDASCDADHQCQSLVCSNNTNTCQAPSCTDGVKNGIEIAVNCAPDYGILTDCYPCPAGTPCGEDGDCLSRRCVGNVCEPSQECAYCLTADDCVDENATCVVYWDRLGQCVKSGRLPKCYQADEHGCGDDDCCLCGIGRKCGNSCQMGDAGGCRQELFCVFGRCKLLTDPLP